MSATIVQLIPTPVQIIIVTQAVDDAAQAG